MVVKALCDCTMILLSESDLEINLVDQTIRQRHDTHLGSENAGHLERRTRCATVSSMVGVWLLAGSVLIALEMASTELIRS
jgi:hypothetical protein